MSGWDAVAQVDGPNFQYLFDVSILIDSISRIFLTHWSCQTSKAPQVINFIKQDAPQFVNIDAGHQIIPCDIVSFQIPK